jgi:hypothetical protein
VFVGPGLGDAQLLRWALILEQIALAPVAQVASSASFAIRRKSTILSYATIRTDLRGIAMQRTMKPGHRQPQPLRGPSGDPATAAPRTRDISQTDRTLSPSTTKSESAVNLR